MRKGKKAFLFLSVLILSVCVNVVSVPSVSAKSNAMNNSKTLNEGMKGSSVYDLQNSLKQLGFFNAQPTGYFGRITVVSVKNIQKSYGLSVDGIAGRDTMALINRLLTQNDAGAQKALVSDGKVSRDDSGNDSFLTPWFGGVENIFSIKKVAVVYDVDTGLKFNIIRSYGYNHADCETLTAADTAVMKKICGGQWSWQRRAVIVTVDGKSIAASMAGMPHAGEDSLPANTYVTWRSEGYGPGTNLDQVKGNGMNGHFDIHFLGSKTHGTNRVDEGHQDMVHKAAQWAESNLR